MDTDKLYYVRLNNLTKFVVRTLVLLDKTRTEVLTTYKFYYGSFAGLDIICVHLL